MILIHSPFSRPSFNLALEEYLLSEVWKGQSIVLLYENEDAVVMGKNQNFFSEVNLPAFINNDIPVYRRVSGGGTVYHGPGNLNFAFVRAHEDRLVSNFKLFNQPIVKALNEIGVAAKMNERNDILCKGFKISGNAQFTNRKRIISHGTLLLHALLDRLNGILSPNSYTIESRAISSVRSKVANINSFLEHPISIDESIEAIVKSLSFEEDVLIYGLSAEDVEATKQLEKSKYQTEQWNFFRASKCKIRREFENNSFLEIEIVEGRIVDVRGAQHSFTEGEMAAAVGKVLNPESLRETKKPDAKAGLLHGIFFG